MSEFLLDQKLVDRLVADMEYELDRKAPPENFPQFPDIPSAPVSYTHLTLPTIYSV